VPAGSVLGLLGHNGAGKTTAIRILTTLALPTEGRAEVAGLDVVREAAKVRGQIGLAGQYATVDGLLTARANVELAGRLYHLPRDVVRRRTDELLERVGLTDVAGDRVSTFSAGCGAGSTCGEPDRLPPVLFLDEPTTGLDPSRATTCGGCCGSSSPTAPRFCSRRNTWTRPIASPTRSSCSTTAASSRPARRRT